MKKIIAYELLFAALTLFAGYNVLLTSNPFVMSHMVALLCVAISGLGGCLYCLRAVYLHRCAYKNWDDDWQAWYYLRPIVSLGAGGTSYLFLQAGLLVLESQSQPTSTEIGFYALAFIAGYNVDKFLEKIEDVAAAVWGIQKSRGRSAGDNNREES